MLKMRIKKKHTIAPFYWLLILFLQPPFLAYRTDLSILYDLWHYTELLVTAWFVIKYMVLDRFRCWIINLILLYYAWVCLACAVNGYSPISIIWELVPDIGISLFVYFAMKRNEARFVDTSALILIIYVLINFVTMIAFPDGIASGRIGQTMWFLGGKNVIIPYVLLGGDMAVLRSYLHRGRDTVATYIVILLLSLAVLFTESSTTILLAVLFVTGGLVEILIRRRIFEKLFSGRNLFLLVVGIFLFVIFFSSNKSIVADITSWLGRDITFNGRTALWASALSKISSSPVFGVGPDLVLDVGWQATMTHAHDLYLNVAAKYGIPAFVLLVVCLIYTFRYSKVSKVPLAYYALALYLVGCVVEVYSTNTLFFFCVALSLWGAKRDKLTVA